LEHFLEEERAYLHSLHKPHAMNEFDVSYIEALEAWEDAE